MADFNSANKIDLTPQALAMIRLIQAGQAPTSDTRFTGRFGPGFPPMPVEPEAEPRLFQYTPGTNLMMIPRAGYNVLPYATIRAMAGACKEIRLNIEHIKRVMRGVEWDIVPNDKKKTVVGGKTYVATPETDSVKQFFNKPDGTNSFDAWLNMVLEEILVTDALTLWPVVEAGRELTAIEVIDGTTIKPLLDMRGATPRPPAPAYIQIIYGTPQSSYPSNTLIYKPLNTKVNTPYGESPVEWILTAINTAIRYDLSKVGYFSEGNIPGAFYTVPESWTPEQIDTFQQYIDALMAGDLSRFAKLLAVPGGTGSHVTTFQNNDPDNTALNTYLMQVACWAYGNSPAEFGLTGGGEGLGGAGFMAGNENIQYRSMIGPVSGFLADIFTDLIHTWMRRPDLRFAWTGLEPVEDRAAQATTDASNVQLGVYTVAYIQDRDGIPQEYRPESQPAAQPAGIPIALPPEYERYLKSAVNADLKKWEEKSLRALKKGWGVASFTSEVIPAGLVEKIESSLRTLEKAGALDEASVKSVFTYAGTTELLARGDDPEDLTKGAPGEQELVDDLAGYFAGLADRITVALAATSTLEKSDKPDGGDGGEKKEGEEESPFVSDAQRRAAFASMRERGDYRPGEGGGKEPKKKDGPENKNKKETGPAGKTASDTYTLVTNKNRKTEQEVKDALSNISKVHGMPEGMKPVPIDGKNSRGSLGTYFYRTGSGTPLRIGIKPGSDHARMNTAHELGHHLDHSKDGLGYWGGFGSERGEGEVAGVMKSARESQTIQDLKSGKYDYREYSYKLPDGTEQKDKVLQISKSYKKYLLSGREVFARAYCQYIAVRSKDPAMLKELDSMQEKYAYFQWSDDEFEPIAAEFDKMFKAKGLIK